jgi:hypothetical protein
MANEEKKVENVEESAAKKAMSISVQPEQIMGASIEKSGDYKYASMGVKMGENQFLRISYEWKGEEIPEFVMSLMGWMQSNKADIDKSKAEFAAEYKSLMERKV